MAEPALIRVEDLETCYGSSQVLFGISLAIAPREMVTLMGRNGMGKTTTVRSIMGLTPAVRGSIQVDGKDVRGWPAHRVAKLGIGLVPEGRQVFPNLTTRENLVATAANRHGNSDPWTLDKVCALFARLSERLDHMANQLSGGEQQMLAIGRGMMAEPRLLILDEPSLGLSPLLVEEMFGLISRLHAEGLAILLVEQNVVQSLDLASRAYVIENGQVVLSGSARELSESPALKRAYLGI